MEISNRAETKKGKLILSLVKKFEIVPLEGFHGQSDMIYYIA